MQRSDFDFDLPDALVAQYPLARRSDSRLLDCSGDALVDRAFAELPMLLRAGDTLIFNDTRVINARLHATKETGGRVEILIERIDGERQARAQLRASHAPKAGARLSIESAAGAATIVVGARDGDFHTLHFDRSVDEVLETHGKLPLPPYIEHLPDDRDAERYQTVWAIHPGAVAAPTAGLHFDQPLVDAIEASGVTTAAVTLHVGAGTFMPVRVDDLSEHVMHEERFVIPQRVVDVVAETRARGGRIVSVGTTTLRALEAATDGAGQLHAGPGSTRLFITPGYVFRTVDRLVTNFHLPQSTLLMLVSAFAGSERIRRAYRHAIDARYRFFSYGDAMLLDRAR